MNPGVVLKVLFALIVQGCCWSLQAADFLEDVGRVEQQTGLVRYPGASIEHYQNMSVEGHQLVTGGLKIVNGLLKVDDAQRVSGVLHQITYRIPEGYSSLEAFSHYRALITQADGQILYECQARQCGASNLWANRVFKVAKLYGPDQYQHYLTAILVMAERQFAVAVYSIQRGNRRVYLHLELVEQEGSELAGVAINPETLLGTLRQDGRWVLDNLAFDENNELKSLPSAVMALAAAMEKDVRLKVYLVGHLSPMSDMTTGELIASSKARAESVKRRLTGAGVTAERIEAHGVGPLAPLFGKPAGRGRVEVVLKLR